MWSVIVDYGTGQWTYGVYPTEAEARQAISECAHVRGTLRIRRDT